jgi:hypothetical protein
MEHGKAVEPVVIAFVSHLKFGRGCSEESTLKPVGQCPMDRQVLPAGFPIKRSEPKVIACLVHCSMSLLSFVAAVT